MTGSPLCFGVLGDPVAHSRSPAMHSAAFAEMGLTHRYLPFHVTADRLGRALRGAAALGFGGLNLTVPHKVAALPHLDALDDRARRVGAVNTVRFTAGEAVGHNTDGVGLVRALEELGGSTPARVVVLGSGGAARSVVDALREHAPGSALDWVSRDPAALPAWEGVHSMGYDALGAAGDPIDLLINATTVGMAGGPTEFPTPPPLGLLSPGARVVDLVYPRPVGGLLEAAAALGARTQDGLPMLLWQGVAALELWLERQVPAAAVVAMRAALM